MYRSSETPFVSAPSLRTALAALAVGLLLQMTVLHFALFRGSGISLVLLVVIWYAHRSGAAAGALFGLLTGALEDSLSGGTGGAWTVATTLTAIAAGSAGKFILADSFATVATLTAAATVLRETLFWSVMELQGYPIGLGALHAHAALWEALFNAVAAGVGFALLQRRAMPNRW